MKQITLDIHERQPDGSWAEGDEPPKDTSEIYTFRLKFKIHPLFVYYSAGRKSWCSEITENRIDENEILTWCLVPNLEASNG